MHLSEKIIYYRRRAGLSQEQLAAMCDVSRQTISSLENGRYNPSIGLAHKVAVFFGLTIEDVFIFEEE